MQIVRSIPKLEHQRRATKRKWSVDGHVDAPEKRPSQPQLQDREEGVNSIPMDSKGEYGVQDCRLQSLQFGMVLKTTCFPVCCLSSCMVQLPPLPWSPSVTGMQA